MPKGKRAEKSDYQKRLDEGFTPEQARELVLASVRAPAMSVSMPAVTAPVTLPVTAIRAQEAVTRGPDPEVVARHQAATANLPPPPPNVTLTLELEPRWFQVLETYTEILRGQRKLPDMQPAQALVQLIRWASAAHPDIVLVRTQGKGKAAFVHPDQKGAA